jgi:hypothetical protein
MTIEITRATTRLDDALFAFAQAGAIPDAEALEKLVRQYPDHAETLTEMAIELALDALSDESEEEVSTVSRGTTSPAVAEAMSHFHNRLYAVKIAERSAKTRADAPLLNPFAALDRSQLRSLGERLNVNTVFVLKLRDRLIEAETIPENFRKTIAEELKAPFDIVSAHFAGRAVVASSAHYKADGKPEAGRKQPFEEAVKNSGLSDDQQAFLLNL